MECALKIFSINAQSYGPIKNFSPLQKGGEFKRIVAFVGANGAGKTTLISCILDLMSTLKHKMYNDTMDTDNGSMLKVISGTVVNSELGTPSYFSIGFEFNGKLYNFYEIIGENSSLIPEEIKNCLGVNIKRFNEHGRIKNFDKEFQVEPKNFHSTVMAFYPADRGEIPAWINPNSKIKFNTVQAFVDQDSYSLWRTNISDDVEQWLLDIILDAELYDNENIIVKNGSDVIQAKIPRNGKHRSLLNNINMILSQIISSGPSGCISARIAVGQRNRTFRNVCVIGTKTDGKEYRIAPSLRSLSTGELNIFLIFSDILRIAELNAWDGENMDDIKGVIVIDEIDTHLHIKLQTDLSNKLFSLLKSVQFIFTTHSPFLLMGLKGEDSQIYEVPSGIPISEEDYSEFQVAYKYFIKEQDNYKEKYEDLSKKMQSLSVPLIITEGKTDWKHFKYASEKLSEKGELQFPSVEWYESLNDMGDSELYKIFEVWSKMDIKQKVICVFDRDNSQMLRKISSLKNTKNVSYVILSVPDFRDEFTEISIEHLYKNCDLKRVIPGTQKRLRFISELGFSYDRNEVWIEDENNISNIKIYDQDVMKISLKGGGEKGCVAISKNTFLEEIVSKNVDSIDFSGFLPTLKEIARILSDVRM